MPHSVMVKSVNNSKKIIVCLLIFSFLLIYVMVQHQDKVLGYDKQIYDKQETEFQKFQIDGMTGDNINGFPKLIVPNIVHYIMFQDNVLSFIHYISIKSVLRHQRPDSIMIHCDFDIFKGPYWDKLMLEDYGRTKFVMRKIKYPDSIFGKKFSAQHRPWHASDVARIRVLMEFGGIYLDRDIYIAKSLDPLRKFEMTLDTEDQIPTNAIQMGHKDARFLKLYLDLYHNYNPWSWTGTSQSLPGERIIKKQPHLVHQLVKNEFGVQGYQNMCRLLYQTNSRTWRDDYFTVHMYMRGNSTANNGWCWDRSLPIEAGSYNEETVKRSNVTFGQLARLVLYNTTELIA